MEETVVKLDDNEKQPCIFGQYGKPLNLQFTNLNFKASGKKGQKGKYILKSLSGKCESGKLTAILGPSGAGKSSLLNVLSGFRTSGVTGSITVNGQPRSPQEFKKQSCYIPQEFALMPLLTARETLKIATDLKFGFSVNSYRKDVMINEILRLLSLLKSCDTLVKHLSGGEKKRLSIGVELLTNPPIMFFDEPTSGLDSSSATELMSHLKNLAQYNRSIVCVVHQPSSRMFNTFDNVYVLVQGQFVYGGPTVNLVTTFTKYGFECPQYYNPAEFVLEVAKHNEELLLKSASSAHLSSSKCAKKAEMDNNDVIIEENFHESYDKLSEKRSEVSVALQCLILLKRAMVCAKRDMYMTYFKFITSLLTGLLVGVLWWGAGNKAEKVLSNLSAIFILVSAAYALNCLLTVMSYPSEAAAVSREHRNNWYTTQAYFLSKLLAELPLQIISGTMLVIPLYFMTDQPIETHRILIVWLVTVLLVIMAQIHGLAFGTLFSCEVSVNILIFCAIVLSIMSGFPLRVHFIPVFARWFTYMNFMMYGLDAIITAIYGMDRENLDCEQAYCYFRSPRKILEEMHMGEYDIKWDIIGLFIWILVLQALFFFALKWKHRMSK